MFGLVVVCAVLLSSADVMEVDRVLSSVACLQTVRSTPDLLYDALFALLERQLLSE